jgi:hypothetical protein
LKCHEYEASIQSSIKAFWLTADKRGLWNRLTAQPLNNLAAVSFAQGHYDEAKILLDRVLTV